MNSKTWWGAIWRGLVVDEAAKHYRAMNGALWLFIYLIIHADRTQGVLYRKYETIARDMHISSHTVRRWIAVLRQHDYIHITNTGRGLRIHIQKWKTLSASPRVPAKPHSE